MNIKILHFIFISVALILIQTVGYSQKINFGIPEIHNYNRLEYKGGTQSWEIINAKNNRIFVANNEGLLMFDGHKWEKYVLPNKTILRSISYDSTTQKIYAGGQDELGYFEPDKQGVLKYYDLKQTIPLAFNQLEDVWNIKFFDSKLYFRSINKIYSYDGNQWEVITTKETTYLALVQNTIVYNDVHKGLFKIIKGNSEFIEGSEILKNKTITSILLVDKQWLIFTEKDGIFIFSNNAWQSLAAEDNHVFKAFRIHSACNINDSTVAVGTYLKGIFILDAFGKIKSSFTKEIGLQNNTIGSLHYTSNHQLWAGTYNGIDMIDIGSALKNIYPDGPLQGTVYATLEYNSKLYCGTENGLYYIDLNNTNKKIENSGFQLVENTKGQVWGLDIVLGDLILSHNDGAFVISGNKAEKISSYNGSWKFLEFGDKNYCIGGAYSGMYAFRKFNGIWEEMGKIAGFDESCRIMTKNDQYVWVSHPYRGLFRMSVNIENLTASIENFGQKNGLPGNLRNVVYNIDDQIIVATEFGTFKYNTSKNTFDPFKFQCITNYKNLNYKYLTLHNDKLWFATDEHFGYLSFDKKLFGSKKYTCEMFELRSGLVPGFEKIFPLNNSEALLLTTKGLKYFSQPNNKKKLLQAYISKVFDSNHQKLIAEGFETMDSQSVTVTKFDYRSNAFIFDFASSKCSEDIKYRYLLSPIQKEWSTWDYKSQKEFNNLPSGKYELKLEASDMYGQVSNTFIYPFEILSPWYQSKIAYIIYILTGVILLLNSRRRLVKKYELITTDLEEQKNESEALIYQLQKDKLEAEIQFKNKELGLSTMHLVQKNEAISKLKSELNKIVKKIVDPEIKKEIKSMMSILSDDERLDDEWDSFAQNFDAVHNDTLVRLKSQYPQLSPSDLKLCAYLKLNLTTKEIAPLLNISVRGVEISRYRLRKKLSLSNDVNLNDFMMQY